MNKFWMCFLTIIMAIGLNACGTSVQSAGAAEPAMAQSTAETDFQEDSAADTPTDAPTDVELSKPGMRVETKYFTVSVPESWKQNCVYEVYAENDDCAVSFYEKASYDAIGCGWLFSIDLIPESEDYSYYPNYDVLGRLEVPSLGVYHIVVTYPTDVQFSEENAKTYHEMFNTVPEILDTISFMEGCVFSDIPAPAEIVEETNP